MRSTWSRTLNIAGRRNPIKGDSMNKISSRTRVVLALSAALCIAAFAAARATDNDPTTLRLLLWQAPTTLNPHFADGIKDQEASRIAYEPLASFDRDGKMVPFLAAE